MNEPQQSPDSPLFSLIVVADCFDSQARAALIKSLRDQDFAEWELIVVAGADDSRSNFDPEFSGDNRVVVIDHPGDSSTLRAANLGIAAASGEFVIILDRAGALAPGTLACLASAVTVDATIDLLYTDEDYQGPEGTLTFKKPEWSPERLRSQWYCGELSALRSSLVRDLGGLRDEFQGAELYDLTLRVSEKARTVHHVQRALFHHSSERHAPTPDQWYAGRRAVQAQLDRAGIDATVELNQLPGTYRVDRRFPAARRVSIIIPTIGVSALVWGERRTFVVEAVRSVLAKTDHDNIEIVVVHDAPTPAPVLAELRDVAGDRLVLVPFDAPFNFSRKINAGFVASTGDRIVLLNDDVQVRSDRWLEALLAPLESDDVGMTGAKLYFANNQIQHVGHHYLGGNYGHPFILDDADTVGPFAETIIDREASGVTAACAGLRREVFEEVGGLTELLPLNYNDVDLSYKIRHQGYRILYIAQVELYHFESQTRESAIQQRERELVHSRWGTASDDPYLPAAP
ncbi:GT2 family glycosyltransferase [Jatrophihabitans sp. GAS493]|uniref:glycosyltransferase family 2 protein n=1 Tax=Jatrophihabitans sp. GAS493 TaxID=1907575 RepID=UPI000BB6CDF5|nr:glycosyltransferase [Jatrophihabitans sp. GAS493]SOD70607.1 GT2 family glycosyltransferase [Jatrophihabitans sp. GAS493]